MEERLGRADTVQSEVENARRQLLAEQWARKEESIAFASSVRKAAETRQKQLVEELEEFRELQAKKAQMEEAVARDRQERQKKLTAELHAWREKNRREVFDAPGPSDFVSPETFAKGRPVGGVEREEGPSWSRADRVTSMAATAAKATKLPGPPRHLPFVLPTPGGRVSTSRGVGFTYEVIVKAKSLPGPGDYDVVACETRASARGSQTPGAFAHRVRRAFEGIEADAARSQPVATLPPVDTLRELNKPLLTPKQMIRGADRDGLLSLSASQRVLDSMGPELSESAGLGASGFIPTQLSPPLAGSARPASHQARRYPAASSPREMFDSGSEGESQASSSGPATSASRRNASQRPLLVPLDASADDGLDLVAEQGSEPCHESSSAKCGAAGSPRAAGLLLTETAATAGSEDEQGCPEREEADPDMDDHPDGEQPDGEQPDGEQPDGEQPDGEQPDGEQPDSERPDGEQPDVENQPDAAQASAVPPPQVAPDSSPAPVGSEQDQGTGASTAADQEGETKSAAAPTVSPAEVEGPADALKEAGVPSENEGDARGPTPELEDAAEPSAEQRSEDPEPALEPPSTASVEA